MRRIDDKKDKAEFRRAFPSLSYSSEPQLRAFNLKRKNFALPSRPNERRPSGCFNKTSKMLSDIYGWKFENFVRSRRLVGGNARVHKFFSSTEKSWHLDVGECVYALLCWGRHHRLFQRKAIKRTTYFFLLERFLFGILFVRVYGAGWVVSETCALCNPINIISLSRHESTCCSYGFSGNLSAYWRKENQDCLQSFLRGSTTHRT